MAVRYGLFLRITRLLLTGVLPLVVSSSWASPAALPLDGYSLQPDGSEVRLRLVGDGETLWYEHNGFPVIKNDTGVWVYAQQRANVAAKRLSTEQILQPTSLIVGTDDPVVAGLTQHLALEQSSPVVLHKAVGGGNSVASRLGAIPLLVIMGYYDNALGAANCTACATTDPKSLQQLFFAQGEGAKSVADYFEKTSNGQFKLPPVVEDHGTLDDGVVGWLRLGGAMPESSSMETSAYKSNRIAADAINLAMSHVDFTAYDVNGDGNIRSDELAIVVIVAGYEGSYGRDQHGRVLADDKNSPRIWAQSRSFVTSFSGVEVPRQTKDGRTVSINTSGDGMAYSIIGERHGNHAMTMGIAAHELGHSLFGLPDLYDISGVSNGVGGWSLMSYGSWGKTSSDSAPGETPVLMDGWSRLALGWITPIIPNSDDLIMANAAANSAGNLFKLPTVRANEYFLVENRHSSGYDLGLSYFLYVSQFSGLAVWHIDDSVGSEGLNNDNGNAAHRRVDLVAAMGDTALDSGASYGQVINLYYAGNIDSLSDGSHKGMNLYSGEPSGVTISDIALPTAALSFRITYADNGVAATAATTTTSLSTTDQANAVASPSGGGGGWTPAGLLPMALWGWWRRLNRTTLTHH
ncbi:MAG: metalloprotease domain protein [Halothiobacillaceae bacterium]|nr:MAG: metalloprotease domain protein [Halothiobacillaceae bacterium]